MSAHPWVKPLFLSHIHSTESQLIKDIIHRFSIWMIKNKLKFFRQNELSMKLQRMAWINFLDLLYVKWSRILRKSALLKDSNLFQWEFVNEFCCLSFEHIFSFVYFSLKIFADFQNIFSRKVSQITQLIH